MENFNGKSILVTGATGLIGYNLTLRLLRDTDAVITVTGRSIKKLENTFHEYLNNERLICIEHDASTPLPPSIKVADYIFHAAGPIERDVIINHPVNVVLPNIQGSIYCMEFLRNQIQTTGVLGRMIVFSSVTVYNNPTDSDYIAVEDDTTHSISLNQPYAAYAESKRMIEVIARSYYRQYGINTVIARFSTVYGYTPNVPDSAFYEFIDKALKKEKITINSAGLPRRDNIYVDDAVDGLIIIAQKGEAGESYNISSNGEKGNYLAVDEIAKIISHEVSSLLNYGSDNIDLPEELPRKPGLMLDNSKLKSLGWVLKTRFKDGVIATIRDLYSL